MIQLDLSESCSGEAALILVPRSSLPRPCLILKCGTTADLHSANPEQKCQNWSADNRISLAITQNFLTNLFLSHLLGTLNKGILVIKCSWSEMYEMWFNDCFTRDLRKWPTHFRPQLSVCWMRMKYSPPFILLSCLDWDVGGALQIIGPAFSWRNFRTEFTARVRRGRDRY